MPYRSEAERAHVRKHYPTIAAAWDREEADLARKETLPQRATRKPARVTVESVASRLVNKPAQE
jgi:hypothetical protein